MIIRDNKEIFYRSISAVKDAHGTVSSVPSEELSSIIGRLKPRVIKEEVQDAGLVLTGDYIIYVPLALNPMLTVKQGDGFYLADDTDTTLPPKWFVSNVPHRYLKYTMLILRKKV